MMRALASGRLVAVEDGEVAQFMKCGWLIQIPTNNPEPDSVEDTYQIVDCMADLYALTDDPEGGWRCAAGHSHWPYGTEENRLAELEADYRERTGMTA